MPSSMNEDSTVNVPFTIVDCSSQHQDYPATHLENDENDRMTKKERIGWQSKRNCTYPQHIIVKPTLPDNVIGCNLKTMRILIHESKIPSKIELFFASSSSSASPTCDSNNTDSTSNETPSHADEAEASSNTENHKKDSITTSHQTNTTNDNNFRRLGYITFGKNQKSDHRTRELKSISLSNVSATQLKLVIHKCHESLTDLSQHSHHGKSTKSRRSSSGDIGSKHQFNPYGQVGIVSISLLGSFETMPSVSLLSTSTAHIAQIELDEESSKQSSDDGDRSSGKEDKCSRRPNQKLDACMPDKEFYIRFNKLEKMKLSCAAKEDFELAAKIKDCLSRVHSLLDKYGKLQSEMSHAADIENYAEASRLKSKRDDVRSSVFDALMKAEKSILGNDESKDDTDPVVVEVGGEKSSKLLSTMTDVRKASANNDDKNIESTSTTGSRSHHNILEDLSISTIRAFEENDPSPCISSSSISNNDNDLQKQQMETSSANNSRMSADERPIHPSKDTSENKENMTSQDDESYTVNDNDDENGKPDESKSNDSFLDDDGKHPLFGVPNFENLPVPEEIRKNDGIVDLLKLFHGSSANTSSDSIDKIESILGAYTTRCFFSKNWLLREAALVKASMILPQLVDEHIATIANNETSYKYDAAADQLNDSTTSMSMDDLHDHSWYESFSRTMCIILEIALGDKITQVFLTALLVLDDCIIAFENLNITQKEVVSLLSSNIVPALVVKLGDGKAKVADGVEMSLLSLAFSTKVGPMFIGVQIMRQHHHLHSSTKDGHNSHMNKMGGKLICAIFQLLKELVNEFGSEAPQSRRIMDFMQEYGFTHKDSEVRDAAKELTTCLFVRDDDVVASMIMKVGLTDRQIKEYKASFSLANRRKNRSASCVDVDDPNQINDGNENHHTKDTSAIQQTSNLDHSQSPPPILVQRPRKMMHSFPTSHIQNRNSESGNDPSDGNNITKETPSYHTKSSLPLQTTPPPTTTTTNQHCSSKSKLSVHSADESVNDAQGDEDVTFLSAPPSLSKISSTTRRGRGRGIATTRGARRGRGRGRIHL